MNQTSMVLLKAMAWERAKGELRAVLVAERSRWVCDDYRPSDSEKPRSVAFNNAVEAFIEQIEDAGFIE